MFTYKISTLPTVYTCVAVLLAPVAATAETNVDIYGYTKLDLIFDLDADLGDTTGGLGSLTPGFESDTSSNAHARQSRLGLRIDTDTPIGQATAIIEGDFFGAGGSNDFRLRKAYGELNGFLAGQTWTNFMPIESYPTTVDFNGPVGLPFERVAQLRYTFDAGSGFKVSGSVEEDPRQGAAGGNIAQHLALTAAASYDFNGGFIKLAGISRQLNGATEDVDGFGVNLSGNFQPWQGGDIRASFTTGEGIGSYLLPRTPDVIGNDAVEAQGFSVAVSQDISEQFEIGVAYGRQEMDFGALTDTEVIETVHLSAFYKPVSNVTVGLEYFTGEREVFAGDSAEADRIQASVQFNF